MNSTSESTLADITAGTFLQRLKQATAGQHAALEALPTLAVIMQPDVTVNDYHFYLLRMLQISRAYECVILPQLAHLALPLEKNNSQVILHDLRQLGLKDEILKSENFDLSHENITTPLALGFAYVMEGSKLGGKVIYKHLQKVLGISEDKGGAYVADKDNNTGTNWKSFLSVLSTYATDTGCEEEIIQGANFAFQSINTYFALRTVHV